MTRVKICGIKTEENAVAVAELGADFIGFVFAPSPRQVSPATARKLSRMVKSINPSLQTVGVFVNTPVDTIRKIVDLCQLDWVQLSGDESSTVCRNIAHPAIKAIRISRNQCSTEIINYISQYSQQLGDHPHLFLLDSFIPDRYGGTGLSFDWKMAEPIADYTPLILAGGLSSENVSHAIETIQPWAVDVSSGVEMSPGNKDITMMKSFIAAVRNQDAKSAG